MFEKQISHTNVLSIYFNYNMCMCKPKHTYINTRAHNLCAYPMTLNGRKGINESNLLEIDDFFHLIKSSQKVVLNIYPFNYHR